MKFQILGLLSLLFLISFLISFNGSIDTNASYSPNMREIIIYAPEGYKIVYAKALISNAYGDSDEYKSQVAPEHLTNTIILRVPYSSTAHTLEVLTFPEWDVVPEWRVWNGVNLDIENFDYILTPPTKIYPEAGTIGKIPLIYANDEHLWFQAGRGARAVNLTVTTFEGERFTITPNDIPFYRPVEFMPSLFIDAERRRAGFYFDIAMYDLFPTDIAEYELNLIQPNSSKSKQVISTYKYTTDTSTESIGLLIKHPAAASIHDYALIIEDAYNGQAPSIPDEYEFGSSLYFMNWDRHRQSYPEFTYTGNFTSMSASLSNSFVGYRTDFNYPIRYSGENAFIVNPVEFNPCVADLTVPCVK